MPPVFCFPENNEQRKDAYRMMQEMEENGIEDGVVEGYKKKK